MNRQTDQWTEKITYYIKKSQLMLENKNRILKTSKLMKYPRIHNKYASMFIWVTEICRFALYLWRYFGEYKNRHISLIFRRIKKTKLVLKLSHQKIRYGANKFWKKWFWKKLSRPYKEQVDNQFPSRGGYWPKT